MSLVSVSAARSLHYYQLQIEWSMDNEVTVLFGRSGSGKTMTLKMIAGLEEPDSGEIRIGDTMVFASTLAVNLSPQKRRVGYVFQQAALFPHMTVEENVAYGTGELNWRRRIPSMRPLLQAVRTDHLADRYPARISGGEAQRVALARALAGAPRVLLLDEPFSALDKTLRREMGELVLSLRERFRVPVVLVTHDPEEARVLGDRIVHYAEGRATDLGAARNFVGEFGSPADGPSGGSTEDIATNNGAVQKRVQGRRVSICLN